MKERPISYITSMVQAILEDRKKLTRRLCGLERMNENPDNWNPYIGDFYIDKKGRLCQKFYNKSGHSDHAVCKFGKPGDLLWVRETYVTDLNQINYKAGNPEVKHNTAYANLTKWKSGRFMPRAASRITLKIISIKVDRLQNITQEDAKKEGATLASSIDYFSAFAGIWGGIHGYHGWVSNPWVWVIEFERL